MKLSGWQTRLVFLWWSR